MLIQSEVHVRTGRVAIPASGYTLILRTLVRDKVVIMSRHCLLFERTNFLPKVLILLDCHTDTNFFFDHTNILPEIEFSLIHLVLGIPKYLTRSIFYQLIK